MIIETTLIQKIVAWVIPVLFAITVHETAHGLVAKQLGDRTAQMLGRLTLNPLKHIDPVGTLLVPGLMLLMPGGFVFGWAKPVPVDWRNLNNPKKDMAWVALAGPVSNLLMAIFWAMIIRFAMSLGGADSFALPLMLMGVAGISINTVLMVLNLFPMPPLDGGRVMTGLLPMRYARVYSRIEPYGMFIVIGLLVTGILGQLMWPVMQFFFSLLAPIAGLTVYQYVAILTSLFGG
ncbi:MAG: site-2 protease family protein [Gammaproteobacteria bacterium]